MERNVTRLTTVLLSTALLVLTPQLARAAITMCLDFDGHHIERWRNHTDIDIPPFNRPNSDENTLDSDEKRDVDQIRAMMEEDFAPFNIDIVTEEQPLLGSEGEGPRCPQELPKGSGLRVVVGGDSRDFDEDFLALGYAITGAFRSSSPDVPNVALAFAYDNNASMLPASDIAKTASHEAGHVLALQHQAEYDGSGNWVDSYEPGNLDMSPLMGDYSVRGGDLPADPLRTTWWLGPAPYLADDDGNSVHADKRPAFIQDDMQILASLYSSDLPDLYNCIAPDTPPGCSPVTPNGFGYRTDDHSDTAGGATPLKQNKAGSRLGGSGLIENPRDVDYFSFVVPRGASPTVNVIADVDVAKIGPNLNAMVEIRDFSGTHVYASDGGRNSGRPYLQAHAAAALPPGEYRLRVSSHGDPGDAGRYSVQLAINSGPMILQHVLLKDRIRVTFNEEIEPSTFDASDVIIKGGDGVQIPQSRTTVTKVTTLARTYDVLFPQYTTRDGIESWIGPNIENRRKQKIDQNGDGRTNQDDVYDRALDRTGPQVRRLRLVTDHIEIAFDEPVNPATVNTATVRLFDLAGNPVATSAPVPVDDRHFEIALASYPVGGMRLEIGPQVHDAFGNPMAEIYRLEDIDTHGPKVEAAAFLDNEYLPGYGTLKQTAVLLAFDEVIAASSLVTGAGYNVSIAYLGGGQTVPTAPSPVTISDVSNYDGNGFQGGGTDRLWVVSFYSQGFGSYELTVNLPVTDLYHNRMNQDDDSVNGELFQDVYRFTFEIQPHSTATLADPSDAYRLAGRMLWGDEWLLEHLAPEYAKTVNPVLEYGPLRDEGEMVDPRIEGGGGFENGNWYK